MSRVRIAAVSVLAVLAVGATACTAPTSGPAATPSSMVLADGYEPDDLNPLLGFGQEGASKIYDGLYGHDADRVLQPRLAAAPATAAPDGRSWTVPLRTGVSFHDGTAFDAADVVATYRAILDPSRASTIRSSLPMLTGVEATGPATVRFDLSYPFLEFPGRLTLGVLPSEALAAPGPLANSPVGTAPVGTGPYRLGEWRKGSSMTLEANSAYWGGAPAVQRITIVFATDDNTRAQRVAAGEFDGTVLPPALARSVADGGAAQGLVLREHASADYRTVTMPFANPVTADPAIRAALNRAVNRQGMIDGLLAGQGEPASTPIPSVLPELVEPTAVFGYDPDGAGRILDAAGWVRGPDGTRSRGGTPARFTLMYSATDTVRRDLAQAFASDARAVGVTVALEGLGQEAIKARLGRDAMVLGGGDPFDPAFKSWQLLASANAADGYNNPGSYRNAAVDAALDAALRAPDEAARAAQVRRFQQAYVADPGMVFLAFLGHSYVSRDRWDGYRPVVEPHTHGTTWGPWWNVEDWTPRT
ncbi:ABC transporter substrate-binding protein [Pseudonocardia sediminis]|uniref:ABC transporter substrate-binding protein n=1 Tax=Pseudonocardia sediminis TaxID=1397368 RepID=UPI001A9313E0|nr:ABC transporter substrate-binding protein [Pseudonocardia sediminis]